MTTHAPHRTMHAVRVHAPGDLRVDTLPVPELADGDASVRVRAAGVCATDRKLAARGAPGGAPRILGHEIVGELVTPGDSGLVPGTRVAVAPNVGCGTCPACARGATNACPDFRAFGIHLDGGMAEYLRVPRAAAAAGHLLPLPDGLAYERAVLFEPLACCLEGFEATGLPPGASVLVVACGVMGRLHVALARTLGAGTVIADDRSTERLEHASALGADVLVGPGDDLREAVLGATGGRGVDVAALTVGDAGTAAVVLDLLGREGSMNLFGGFPKDASSVALDANRIHYEGLRVVGTTGAARGTLLRALDLLAHARLDLTGMVSDVRALSDAAAAFEAAGERRHARIVLVPEGCR